MQLPDLQRYDTFAKLLLHNATRWGAEVAQREKECGIWIPYTWADYRDRVEGLARGLLALGIERGSVIGIIGRNRPHWVWAELAAHAVGAMSLGIYQDALAKEVFYLLDHAEADVAFAEDEEQADKLLEIADQLPRLRWIVFNDPRGMRKHHDPRLMSVGQLVETGARVSRERFEQVVAVTIIPSASSQGSSLRSPVPVRRTDSAGWVTAMGTGRICSPMARRLVMESNSPSSD